MKTSIKLLLCFAGLLVVFMLAIDLGIWANYKKGYNGNKPLGEARNGHLKKQMVRPFKVLVVEGNENSSLSVSPRLQDETTDHDVLRYMAGDENHFTFTFHEDTLHIIISGTMGLSLYTNTLPVIHTSGITLNLSNQQLTSLDIQAKDHSNITLTDEKVQSLRINGDKEVNLMLNGQQPIDSLFLQLGQGSSLMMNEVQVGYSDLKLDSLKTLQMNGQATMHHVIVK